MSNSDVTKVEELDDYLGFDDEEIENEENEITYPYLRIKGLTLEEELRIIKMICKNSLTDEFVELKLYTETEDKFICNISICSLVLLKIQYIEPSFEFELVYNKDEVVKIDLNDEECLLNLLYI